MKNSILLTLMLACIYLEANAQPFISWTNFYAGDDTIRGEYNYEIPDTGRIITDIYDSTSGIFDRSFTTHVLAGSGSGHVTLTGVTLGTAYRFFLCEYTTSTVPVACDSAVASTIIPTVDWFSVVSSWSGISSNYISQTFEVSDPDTTTVTFEVKPSLESAFGPPVVVMRGVLSGTFTAQMNDLLANGIYDLRTCAYVDAREQDCIVILNLETTAPTVQTVDVSCESRGDSVAVTFMVNGGGVETSLQIQKETGGTFVTIENIPLGPGEKTIERLYAPSSGSSAVSVIGIASNISFGDVSSIATTCTVTSTGITQLPIDNIIISNPFEGKIILKDVQRADLYLFDLTGKQVAKSLLTAGENKVISKLSSGFYLYKVISKSGEVNGKIIMK